MTFDELYSILGESQPSVVFRARKQELAVLIPEFAKTFEFDQKNEWHVDDLFEHIMMVVDNVTVSYPVRLAALFHDLGKPETMVVDENGVGHFPDHWKKSEEIFEKYQNRFPIDERQAILIRELIYFHDLPITLETADCFIRAFPDVYDMVYMFSLKEADALSYAPCHVQEGLKNVAEGKKIYYETTFEEQKLASYSDPKQIKEERDILLAYFCNQCMDCLVFKTRYPEDEKQDEFLVGIRSFFGKSLFYDTFLVSSKYWDEFKIRELDWEEALVNCNTDDVSRNLKEYVKSWSDKV